MPDASGGFSGGRKRVRIDRLLRSAVGALILRPWFDDAALRLLAGWYFPLSRAWAAALAANGSPEAFCAAVHCRPLAARMLPRVLARAEACKRTLAVAEARWHESFFGGGLADARIEAERVLAAVQLMKLRAAFAPMHFSHPLSPIAFAIETPASVERRHGARLRQRQRAFALPGEGSEGAHGLAGIETSRTYRSARGREGWLRFPAAAAGEVAWARVATPTGGGDRRPTIIFAHGIGMEPEFWGEQRDPLGWFTEIGLRIVRPEAPWHGRRRLPGYFGGEPILARGPGGLLDFMHWHVTELGLLTAWARLTGRGPVAVGGMSLGALTVQLLAEVARFWPAVMRPDAVLLVAPARSVASVALEGSLTRALGVPRAMHAAGWTPAEIVKWSPLLEPMSEPAVDPAHVVVVLGEADDVTLAHEGERLVKAWRVPSDNVFRCPAGHFSTAMGISRDSAPLRRLLQVLARATPVAR